MSGAERFCFSGIRGPAHKLAGDGGIRRAVGEHPLV